MDEIEKGQVSRSAADVYEEFFLPALFEEWAPRVASAAGVKPGDRVLDVACGTGLFGAETAAALEAPFILGNADTLENLFTEAGAKGVEIQTLEGTARFPSIEAWVHTDVRGWTLADRITDGQYELLLGEAQTALRPFASSEGTVRFSSPAHIVTGKR